MSEFFHMGGYGFYVWFSFGVTLALMLLEPMVLRMRRRTILRRVSRMKRMQNGR